MCVVCWILGCWCCGARCNVCRFGFSVCVSCWLCVHTHDPRISMSVCVYLWMCVSGRPIDERGSRRSMVQAWNLFASKFSWWIKSKRRTLLAACVHCCVESVRALTKRGPVRVPFSFSVYLVSAFSRSHQLIAFHSVANFQQPPDPPQIVSLPKLNRSKLRIQNLPQKNYNTSTSSQSHEHTDPVFFISLIEIAFPKEVAFWIKIQKKLYY